MNWALWTRQSEILLGTEIFHCTRRLQSISLTDAGGGGGHDGLVVNYRINGAPDLLLEVEILRDALLDVLGPLDTLGQAVGPLHQLCLLRRCQAAPQCPRPLKLNQLRPDVLREGRGQRSEVRGQRL